LIGFAGARVSAGTIAQELPAGFQRSEFLFAHGFLDRIVHRTELRSEIAGVLAFLVARPAQAADGEPPAEALGLPSFRPLSFLSNLAERVMQTEPEPTVRTNGNGTGPEASPRSQPRATGTVASTDAETTAPVEEAQTAAAAPPVTIDATEPAHHEPGATSDEPTAAAAEDARRG